MFHVRRQMKAMRFVVRVAIFFALSPLAHYAYAVPPDALAAGKLMAFSHAADALESLCPPGASAVLSVWRQRNAGQLAIVRDYGARVSGIHR